MIDAQGKLVSGKRPTDSGLVDESIRDINKLMASIHQMALDNGYWEDYIKATTSQQRMVVLSSMLMLCVTEVSEACEELRKGNINEFAIEMADVVIRALDVMSVATSDPAGVIHKKRDYNKSRPRMHGKLF